MHKPQERRLAVTKWEIDKLCEKLWYLWKMTDFDNTL